jgi:hypothetical protein
LTFFGMGGAFRVTLSLLAAGLLTLVCCGCETTAQKSATLEKQAKHEKLALRGVDVASENPSVKVVGSTVVRSSEGAAVVVALRNTSSHTLVDAPIEITVRDAGGRVLFQNNQPGEDPSLTQVALLEPGKGSVWVDDQVQTTGIPVSASALVGEARRALTSVPPMTVSATHQTGEPGAEAGAAGTVTNPTKVTQVQLVVDAVARKGGRVVAAGRAVLPEVPVGASVPFQLYFVGDPRGAQIETSAPATTF